MATPILYDISRKGRNACWSMNPWKTRLALNYKGIDYKTTFVDASEVESTIKSLGVPPNDLGPNSSNIFPYTIPTVRFPDGTFVMDSFKIIEKMEAVWPDKPPLHIDSPLLSQVNRLMWKFMPLLNGEIIPRIKRNVISEESKPWFEDARSKMLGMSVDQFEREKGGDKAWAEAKEPIEEMAALLKEQGGPFFMGETVSYADFYVVAFLVMFKHLEEGVYERFVSVDPAFEKLYKACEPWIARDDY